MHRITFRLGRRFSLRLLLDRWQTRCSPSLPRQRAAGPRESPEEKAHPFRVEAVVATAVVCPSQTGRNLPVRLLRHRERYLGCPCLLPVLPSAGTVPLPSRYRSGRANRHDCEKTAVSCRVPGRTKWPLIRGGLSVAGKTAELIEGRTPHSFSRQPGPWLHTLAFRRGDCPCCRIGKAAGRLGSQANSGGSQSGSDRFCTGTWSASCASLPEAFWRYSRRSYSSG